MAIELSNLTFTDEDDIVPAFGVEEIFNTGIANTLAGNDRITGIGGNNYGAGINNELGIINTSNGNDTISGIYNQQQDFFFGYGINNKQATIDTGNGNDIITGDSITEGYGIKNDRSTIDTGDGNDIIAGLTQGRGGVGIEIYSTTIDTGNGNDIITGTGFYGISSLFLATLTTGDGNDTITGTSTGDIVTSGTGIANNGLIDTGDGDDVITGTTAQGYGIVNGGTISTGNGNDLIIGIGDISRNDIYNYGTINTGNGDDSIIANGSFRSGFDNQGSVFLGNGKDYIKGFGSGDFYGGNGNDTLELTPGTYTVGIWGEGGESPIFTKGDQLMITSEFEKLKAGGIIYDFTSLTAGQTIVVA